MEEKDKEFPTTAKLDDFERADEKELAVEMLTMIAQGAWGGPDDYIWIDDRFTFTPEQLKLFFKLSGRQA